jgi:hypothetical protein
MASSRHAKFYDISDKVAVKSSTEKINENIIKELRKNSKYLLGDILYLGEDESFPFAIVNVTETGKTYELADHAVDLPFKIKINAYTENIKYEKLLETGLGAFREEFLYDEAEEVIRAYKEAGIY